MQDLTPLPIDAHVPAIKAALRAHRAVVVTAAPGAGKTTRVPPALVEDGAVLLLQPRRVAARAIARRIADERGWTLGREVGWQVRFERRFTRETRLIVATEGVLTARLQQDPLASTFRTIVIDEFHERSLFADVGLALAKQAWLARQDLRLVVMSATIDAARVSAFLGGCPVIDVPGRQHPLDITYRPGESVEEAAAAAVHAGRGALLVFLPGAGEIRRASDRLRPLLPDGVPVLALHGGLPADEQDAALTPGADRRVILATNIAETTITVPDVTAVVDSGLHKVARYDAARGIDSLETERVSEDSAAQRAGRAGRLGPGRVIRLWDARDRLRPHREPEVARVDLASTLLDVIAWGGDPRTFAWYDAPPAHAVDAALLLLRRLEAIDEAGAVLAAGSLMRQMSVHPRLARLLITAGATSEAARACALLSERRGAPAPPEGATNCDLLAAIERPLPSHVSHVARELERAATSVLGREHRAPHDEARFRRAVLSGYPDRVAWRREEKGDRLLLATGAGARLGRESGVHDARLLVAIDVRASPRPGEDAIVSLASAIERDWLAPTGDDVRHELDGTGRVRAWRTLKYGAIVLREVPAPVDPGEAGVMLAAAYMARPRSDEDEQLLARLRFAGQALDLAGLVERAAFGATDLKDVRIARHLPPEATRALDQLAPASLKLPRGRRVTLKYGDDGRVTASVRVQDAFGLAETPRLGAARVPVTFELLAPSGRPVQVTTDLASFWARAYGEVRKELRAKYPKHNWPVNPES